MLQDILKWSLPVQVLLLIGLFLLVSQQNGAETVGPFPPPPRAEQVLGDARTVRTGYGIADNLRYAGIDRGTIAIDEGRLAAARVHRFPAEPLPAEVTLTTQAGRTYSLRFE